MELEAEWKTATGFEGRQVKAAEQVLKRAGQEPKQSRKKKRRLQAEEAPDSEGAQANQHEQTSQAPHPGNGEGSEQLQPDGDTSKEGPDERTSVPTYLQGTTGRGRQIKPNRDFYTTAHQAFVMEAQLHAGDAPGEIMCMTTMFPKNDANTSENPSWRTRRPIRTGCTTTKQ